METFHVEVVVENKPYIRDPEGETILKDLLVSNNYSFVKQVRTARLLRMQVEAENQQLALKMVSKMCDDLRLYNPVVSSCSVSIRD